MTDSHRYFKKMFPEVILELDDLYLLEWFQISYLPGWVPEQAFAAVLQANPGIKRYFVTRYPPIATYIDQILTQQPDYSDQQLADYIDRVLWTIADLLVYNKQPEAYDLQLFHGWDFSEVTDLAQLDDMVVIDAGAGTGRVALEAALSAQIVMAVEPVTRLRNFIRAKAESRQLSNLYVIDGFLHQIPLPDNFADVLITSHALGWQLPNELTEFERVVKSGGIILHCPGTAARQHAEDATHNLLISLPWGYEFDYYEETDGLKRKYWKYVSK